MNLVRAFFPKIGHFSLNFEKGQGRPRPLPPSGYAPDMKSIVNKIFYTYSTESMFLRYKKFPRKLSS